jgi:hypothetical protein
MSILRNPYLTSQVVSLDGGMPALIAPGLRLAPERAHDPRWTRDYAISFFGDSLSAQGLGCMGMSEFYGRTDWDESVATVRRALDLGVTFIDTADIYGAGHNEVLVGRAITGRRDEVQLATKFGIDRSAGDGQRAYRGQRGYVKVSLSQTQCRGSASTIDRTTCTAAQDAEIERPRGDGRAGRRGKVRTRAVRGGR